MLMEGDSDRFREYLRSILYLLILNLLLGASKLFIGFLGQSSAMRSDGWNNSADFLYSLLLTVGLWISTSPADESHPEGHQRFESLVGILIALVILATGAYVLWDAYNTFYHPRTIQIGLSGLVLLVLSMGLKGGVSWFLIGEEERLSSPALGAIGRDQAGDVLADLSVVAAVVASAASYHWIDPAVAAMIGLLILKLGWDPLLENIEHLTGRAPSDDVIRSIEQRVEAIDGFSSPTKVRAHHVGPVLHVSLTVKAPGEISLSAAHDLEEDLRQKILSIDPVERVFIHVEPHEADSPN